jgi:hypothetical protein
MMWQQDEACRKHLARPSHRVYQFHHDLPNPSSLSVLKQEDQKHILPSSPTNEIIGYRRFFAFLTTFQPKVGR